MNLSKNGKVVIFDDQYNAVKGLIGALSKENVPYLFYQDEGGEDLPDSPIQNVRFVFLDLELVTGQKMPDHSIISAIGARLERILEKGNKYILIYWSTKESKYRELLELSFENVLKDYKPIIKLSLNKVEALNQGNNIIEYIRNEINSKSDNFKLFKIFALWENIVNDSAGKLINDFTELIPMIDWDKKAKFVLHKLAEAYSGKQIKVKSESDRLRDSLFTLNHTLIDSLENSIMDCDLNTYGEVIQNIPNIQEQIDLSSEINTRLLISNLEFRANVPGGLFFIDDKINFLKNEITNDYNREISNPKIPDAHIENVRQKAKRKFDKRTEDLNAYEKNIIASYNNIVNSLLFSKEQNSKELMSSILSDSVKIELNISPLCDFAQDKMPCVRILPGLLLNAKFIEDINQKNAYNYVSDARIKYKTDFYYLVFDFRYLYSVNESQLKSTILNYKLRDQFLADIQLKLGSHINRAGILYVS